MDILDDLYWAIDGGRGSGLVFLDLRKAFDTVDHELLLKKLEAMNMSNTSLLRFRDYLSYRTQCTKVNNVVSEMGSERCGVPQGSILGPLLFILYMNDIKQVLHLSRGALYADDTVIWTAGMNIDDIQLKLQQDLLNITQWLNANKLSINVNKCKSMLVSSPTHPIRHEALNLHINDIYLENVASYKFLGIYLDKTLSFTAHVDYLIKKVRKVGHTITS